MRTNLMFITREDAIEEIKRLLVVKSDAQISDQLSFLTGNQCPYEFSVINEYDKEEDEWGPYQYSPGCLE